MIVTRSMLWNVKQKWMVINWSGVTFSSTLAEERGQLCYVAPRAGSPKMVSAVPHVARGRGSRLNPDLFSLFYPRNDREQCRHATGNPVTWYRIKSGRSRPPLAISRFREMFCVGLYEFWRVQRFWTILGTSLE